MKGTILIVDDDASFCRLLQRVLSDEYAATFYTNPLEAIEAVKVKTYDLIMLDLYMPQMTGMEFLEAAKSLSSKHDVLFMTAYAGVETAVEAMKKGASDYLIKPFQNEELLQVVKNIFKKRELIEENRLLKEEIEEISRPQQMIGTSRKMKEVFEIIKKVADSTGTVLITGESGTGKELVARAIHYGGIRKNNRFVPVNCAAIPENLLESELFGHSKGAFSGAQSSRPGLFKFADKGTLFLDEIADIPLPMQTKLLRVIQEQKIRSVGDEEEKDINVRIISATARDLRQMVAKREFREDLFYRINVVPVQLPPLRERKEDIHPLVRHFTERYGLNNKIVSEGVIKYFEAYHWPGNVRELQNTIERMIILSRKNSIDVDDLPGEILEVIEGTVLQEPHSYAERKRVLLEQFNRKTVSETLRESGGNVSRAAEMLGLERASFQRLMKMCGIKSDDFR